MNCQNHPNKKSVATCIVCGKSICDECRINIEGNDYCQECIIEIVATEAPKKIKSKETLKNDSNKNLEKKYEKYLDDLYHDDKADNNKNKRKEKSLKEQLAEDEAKYGSIIKKPRTPTEPKREKEINQNDFDKSNLKSIKINYKNNENRRPLQSHVHSGQTKKNQEASTTTEIVLTVILIIMIILVVSYIIYLLLLSNHYLNFFDAIYALFNNPAEIIENIFS